MKTLIPSLAAVGVLACALLATPASALPVGPALLDPQAGLVEQAGWAQGVERGGKRFLRTTKRYAPKRDVSSTGNVERPSRPRGQAHWGQMPGGPRRHGQ
jgi:hypothetical protein